MQSEREEGGLFRGSVVSSGISPGVDVAFSSAFQAL